MLAKVKRWNRREKERKKCTRDFFLCLFVCVFRFHSFEVILTLVFYGRNHLCVFLCVFTAVNFIFAAGDSMKITHWKKRKKISKTKSFIYFTPPTRDGERKGKRIEYNKFVYFQTARKLNFYLFSFRCCNNLPFEYEMNRQNTHRHSESTRRVWETKKVGKKQKFVFSLSTNYFSFIKKFPFDVSISTNMYGNVVVVVAMAMWDEIK